ncbi:PLP-dependent transferase [Aspergillus novofumigatus IBT 16806]|uniref:Aspartate aminotransferase n=1 Tax=Aspergillus novofumigatus (strain IBT 16806) TaxID=1392255 RepID=A0A2I1CCH4_ASPN1|nr:PLP-dependent transferase [Aspergillus novofumigatus IBT 16806]PKX95311.1 PLP-dependent transferase [Aspergillus novofumigatus IBT 16806]
MTECSSPALAINARSIQPYFKSAEETSDVAFALIEAYKEDPSPCKVDLTPGFYRDEDAKPWVLPSVQKAKQALQSDPTADHEHLPILGHAGLLDSAQRLVFGATSEEARTIASIQTIAGTGANHLGALLLAKSSSPRTVWISDPTWINHHEIWRVVDSGIKRQTYPYFDKRSFTIDFNGIISILQLKATEGDVVVLHGCAHNPTGLDFTKNQWKAIANVCEQKKLVPFFDLAYQGFATGDLAEDAWSVRHFFRNTSLEILVAQSFSKNFGLYGERVGVLHVVCRTEVTRSKVHNMLTRLSRAEITTAPINGARIVAKVLGDKDLKQQWQNDLFHMSDRMRLMRERLVNALRKRQTPGSWDHILTDIGMFSMTCLQPGQIRSLKEEYHVYLLPSGRISMTGLTEHNVEYVAQAFHNVIVAAKPE